MSSTQAEFPAPFKAGTPKAAADRPDRREAILLAAERLFSQQGYHAVSLRQIALVAEVPLALVGYYFGPKQALFHAIFEHWQATIARRLQRLQAAGQAGDSDHTLTAIVEAFVEPVLEMRASAEGEYYALLVARELAFRTPEAQSVLEDYFDPLAHAFIDALAELFAGDCRARAAWAYQFALGALIHHISDDRVARLSLGQNLANAPEAAGWLVRFISAGIAAVMLAPAAPAPNASPLSH